MIQNNNSCLFLQIMVMCECILDNLNIETNMTSLRISHTNSSIKLNNTPRLQRANSHMKTTGNLIDFT